MSRTLTLIHDGWAVAQQFARTGRRAEALAQVQRLLAQPDLPAKLTADAHRLAAELHLDGSRFGTARRHLRAALALEPHNADTHYLAGRAFEEDPEGRDDRAARWFRRASRLAPTTVRYLAAFGRAAVRCDHIRRGVKALRQAAQQAPGDMTILRVAVDGFIEAGRIEDARQCVTRARFLCSATQELDRLEGRVRFEAARRHQRKAQDATRATDGDFATLPFLRIARESSPATGSGTIRIDSHSRPRPHFHRLHSGQSERG